METYAIPDQTVQILSFPQLRVTVILHGGQNQSDFSAMQFQIFFKCLEASVDKHYLTIFHHFSNSCFAVMETAAMSLKFPFKKASD